MEQRAAPDTSDVAVANLPSTSGAHWANRDKEVLYRRPPAENSFPEQPRPDQDAAYQDLQAEAWNAFAAAPSPAAAAAPAEPPPAAPAWKAFAGAGPAAEPTEQITPPAATAATAMWQNTERWQDAEPAQDADASPQSTGSGSPAWTTDVNAAPRTADYNAGPRTTDSNAAPQAAGFTSAPANAGFDSVSANAGFDSAPADAGSDSAPADAGFDSARTVGEFGVESAPATGRASFGISDGPISPTGLLDDDPQPGTDEVRTGELGTGGHEIRPHRAARREVTPAPARDVAEPPRRSRALVAGTVLLAVVVLLGGAVAAGVAFFPGPTSSITRALELGAGTTDRDDGTTAPLAGRTTAALDVVAAAGKVTVRTGDLGDDLYRITPAGGSGARPTALLSGDRVQLYLVPDSPDAAGDVEVLLSARVAWALRFAGGSQEQTIDLTGGRVSAVDLAGGNRRTALTLPVAGGTVPIRVTGAIEDLTITAPAGSPVRVKVDSGARTVAAGTRTLSDVAPGSTLTPKNWKTQNRYDVDAAARVTRLSVRTA